MRIRAQGPEAETLSEYQKWKRRGALLLQRKRRRKIFRGYGLNALHVHWRWWRWNVERFVDLVPGDHFEGDRLGSDPRGPDPRNVRHSTATTSNGHAGH